MISNEYLLHPELIESVPVVGSRLANHLMGFAGEAAVADIVEAPMTVAIRCLNEASQLDALLRDISVQAVSSEVEVLVIDNESTDDSQSVAREHGARVVTLPRDEFTYPRSMNLCMEMASNDLVFLTVAHALLSNTQTLRGGMRHFTNGTNTAGSFTRVLPGPDSSRTERGIAIGNIAFSKPARPVRKAELGVMSATGAIFSKPAWHELGGFDEAYERGGEDTALAGVMLKEDYGIIEEPLLAVHHSHKVGPVNYARQAYQWFQTRRGPQKFDLDKLARRRPDLDLS